MLYLIFNEGYATSSGPRLHRADLSDEAIRLARMVHRPLPDDPEVAGLLALMLLTDARRPARTDARRATSSRWREQDRTPGTARGSRRAWRSSTGRSRAGASASTSSRPRSRPSTTGRRGAEATDWPQILALYGLLERMTGNPVVTLNRAVAAAMAHGPAAGLAILDEVDERLAGHHRLDAVRGHLLEMAGDTAGAARHLSARRRSDHEPP